MIIPDSPRTETDAVAAAVVDGMPPDELEPGTIYGYKLGDRVHVVDLRDRELVRPRRKTGRLTVDDVPSFLHYYGRHADEDTETYVNVEHGVITAVLNAHQAINTELEPDDTARWGDHELTLRLAQTPEWVAWTGMDRTFLTQQKFAEFIDDNRADIRKPAAAEMLEVVQQFQALQKVTFKSATILSNGDRRLLYSEETEAGAGANGQLVVPAELELGIAPFEDSEPYAVKARFRYRIQNGALYMGFLLDNADDVRKDAVKTVVAKIQEELKVTVMRGTPPE